MKKEDSVLSLFPQKKQPFFFAFQESKRKTSNQTNKTLDSFIFYIFFIKLYFCSFQFVIYIASY